MTAKAGSATRPQRQADRLDFVPCAWCQTPLGYVHGHAACLNVACAMFGLNQAECCGGEIAETCPTSTSVIAGKP